MSFDRYDSGEYGAEHPSWHVEDSEWKAARIFDLIESHDLRFETVAEVGCGAGEVLRQLHDRLGADTQFVGYDVSPQAIALAEPRSTANLRFEQRDVREHPTDPFGLVLLIDVIEHVQDYFDLLRTVKRMADYTVLHIPLDLSALTVARPHSLVGAYDSLGHVHFFVKETALRMLADVGFDVLEWRYTKAFEMAPRGRARLGLLNLARRLGDKVSPELTAHQLGGYSLLVLAR